MTYPHEREDIENEADVCIHCRQPWSYLRAPKVTECPARLRARVDELERHVGSITKAQARGYAAGRDEERAATVAFLRADACAHRGPDRVSACADAIAAGDHREGGE